MGNNKFVAFTVVGAVAGAVISMLDRQTRKQTIETAKKTADVVSYYAKNKEELQSLIEEKVSTAQSLYNNVTEKVSVFKDAQNKLKGE